MQLYLLSSPKNRIVLLNVNDKFKLLFLLGHFVEAQGKRL